MTETKRTKRLNSLLREVLSEVIRHDVSNPKVSEFVTITNVEITKDLHNAKVFFSVIGDDAAKKETLDALQSAAGYISVLASKKVTMRHFPALDFRIDNSVEKHLRIESVLKEIEKEREARNAESN